MDRRVLLSTATVLSFVGVLGLYFYSCSIEPISVDIGDIDRGDVGSIVRASGHVKETWLTSNGDLVVVLVDYRDGSSISVYIPEDTYNDLEQNEQLIPGAELEVVGQVQEYNDELEIIVDSDGGIVILKPPSQLDLTIEILVRNPQIFEDLEVTVHGQIDNMEVVFIWTPQGYTKSTSFQLRYSGDYGNYSIYCMIIGYDVTENFKQNQIVGFSGVFEYYEKEARWRIISEEMTLHS